MYQRVVTKELTVLIVIYCNPSAINSESKDPLSVLHSVLKREW
jgi:hypothetical protein